MRHKDSVFWSYCFFWIIFIFHTLLAFSCIIGLLSMYDMAHSSISASWHCNISASIDNSSLTSFSFKHACLANPGAERNKQDLLHKFLRTCFWNFRIRLQVKYYFVHAGCNIDLDLSIQSLPRQSSMLVVSVHDALYFQVAVMKFNWISPNHLCIHFLFFLLALRTLSIFQCFLPNIQIGPQALPPAVWL